MLKGIATYIRHAVLLAEISAMGYGCWLTNIKYQQEASPCQ